MYADLFIDIFDCLELNELEKCQLVSRQWRYTTTNSHVIHRRRRIYKLIVKNGHLFTIYIRGSNGKKRMRTTKQLKWLSVLNMSVICIFELKPFRYGYEQYISEAQAKLISFFDLFMKPGMNTFYVRAKGHKESIDLLRFIFIFVEIFQTNTCYKVLANMLNNYQKMNSALWLISSTAINETYICLYFLFASILFII